MIRASFKNAATNLADYETFILGISMNTKAHSDEALDRIIDLINTRAHKDTIINVGDTLRKYTFMAQGIPENQAIALSLELGDQWIAENEERLQKLNTDFRILRWNELVEDSRFKCYYSAFENALDSSDILKKAVERDIENFYSRIKGQAAEPTKLEVECSRRFFLEELAAYSIQFEDFPSAQLYAGKELASSKAVRLGKVDNVPTGLQNCRFFKICIYHTSNDNLSSSLPLKEELQP